MKRFFTLIPVFIFIAFYVKAQEPSRKNFEPKVYQKDDNIYVNKELPLYLYFSTSKDKSAEKYLLKSKSTPQYANPLFLDTEGKNYIRTRWAVDQKTKKTVYPKQEVLYEIIADGLDPSTSSSFRSAPRYYANGNVYYGKGLTIDLSSSDGMSGVEGTQYSLNGASYKDYSQPFRDFKEGTNNLYYFSHDNVGNAEKTHTRTFIYDVTPPKTTNEVVGIQYGSLILSPSTKISLSSTDNLSGVKKILYSIDEGTAHYYNGSISLNQLNDGDHTIHYHADDNVDNREDSKTLDFYLDKIPPTTAHSLETDVCNKNGINWISTRTKITLTPTDNKAGVYKAYYRIGRSMESVDNQERIDYSQPFSIPDEYGFHVVKYDAMDNVKNLSGNYYLKVYMDNALPQTGIDYRGPQFFNRDTLFITSKTDVVLLASDKGSGVTKTEYKEDGGSMKTYTGKFHLEKEGYRTVTFKSTDCVNNAENEKTSNAFVDNTPPKIYTNFSINPIGKKGKLNIYPNYTRLYIGATDKHVGTETIKYSMNGGAYQLYSSPKTLDVSELDRFADRKKYVVKIQATDKVGNQSEVTVEFYVGLDTDSK